jgi:hypothetical protein
VPFEDKNQRRKGDNTTYAKDKDGKLKFGHFKIPLKEIGEEQGITTRSESFSPGRF